MPTFTVTTPIRAPLELCFDLARDLELHVRSFAHTGERMVEGPGGRFIELGQRVTWEARHFGVLQRLTAEITAFERPCHFQDTMRRGAFARFVHDHHFAREGDLTVMRDVVDFASPLGPLGRLVDALVMTRYLRALIIGRAAVIRAEAERLGSG